MNPTEADRQHRAEQLQAESQRRALIARLAAQAIALAAQRKETFIVLEPAGPVVQDHMDESGGQLRDRGVRGWKTLYVQSLVEDEIAEFTSEEPAESLEVATIAGLLEQAQAEPDSDARNDLIDDALRLLGVRSAPQPAPQPMPQPPPGADIRKWTAEGL